MKAKPLEPYIPARLDDLLTELLCKALGYDFDHTRIKSKAYRPQAFANEQQFIEDVRGTNAFAKGRNSAAHKDG
jgi:hypothetical protein